MKILHIHPAMKGGGIESMICALANEMVKTDDVSVCSIFAPQDNDVFWNKLSKDVRKISIGKTVEGVSFKEIFRIFNLINKGNYDIVNVHGKFYYYLVAVLLLHHKTKFFYTVHSDAKMENLGWDGKILSLKKFCFRVGWIHPITISSRSQSSFNKVYRCDNTLIYNGVKKQKIVGVDLVKPYRITNNTRIFIHAGRIDVPKNQLVLCKVFKRLIDEEHDVVLLIAGSKQKNNIFDSISTYFCERIVYLGERDDILYLMSCCEAMCLPSIWEGLPVTLLEALSVGCIPICSNVGGIPDVVKSGYNGFLSTSASEIDYYNVMKLFLSLCPEDIKQISKNCEDSFDVYDISNTAQEYIKLYNSKLY